MYNTAQFNVKTYLIQIKFIFRYMFSHKHLYNKMNTNYM